MPRGKPITTAVAGALLALAVLASTASAAPDRWTHWNAIPNEATVRSLDYIGPTLFAASEDDGVFTSSSGSFGPWTQMNGGLDPQTGAQSVRQVKAAPTGTLFASTTAGLFSAPPSGSWTQVGGGPGERKLNMGGVQAILFNDASATSMTGATAGAAGAGVYFTSDGGNTWDRASGMPPVESVYSLIALPGGAPAYAAADEGVYVSYDFGHSWTLLSDGLPPGESVFRVAYVDGEPSHLWASTGGGVYQSTDTGFTWEPADGGDGQTLPAGGKRAFFLTPPTGGKFGEGRAVVGTEFGAWATVDNGRHWGQMSLEANPSTPNMNRVVWSLQLAPLSGSLLAGTAGYGVFSLPMQPIEKGTVAVTSTPLKPGETITSKLSGWGGTEPIFFEYQWKRCEGMNCTPTVSIPGATSATYTIPTVDENEYVRYRLEVTAKNLVSEKPVSQLSNITSSSKVAATPGQAPRPSFVNADQPKLTFSNTSQPWGTAFTIIPGKWRTEQSATEIKPTFTYKWMRCKSGTCKEIPGATEAKYTATSEDIAHSLVAYVRGTSSGIPGAFYLAGSTLDVVNKTPINLVKPKIVGEPIAGKVLSSAAGLWDGFDMTYERRWLRCEADGLGCNVTSPVQTGSTYPLGPADVGKRLQLEVTAIGADENQDREATDYSAPTEVITAAPGEGGSGGSGGGGAAPPATPKVDVTAPKKVKPGASLQVPKAFSGFTNVRYQWLRNGKPIKGATKPAYKATKKDAGKKVSCRITMTPAGGGADVVVTTKAVAVKKAKKKHKRRR